MRVIAGEARGRQLEAPPGERTRPMMDRQKEQLFNILMRSFPCDGVLDVFAGSGGLGIEALSRGAARATFIELGRHARPVLERNLQGCGFSERGQVLAADAWKVDLIRIDHPVDIAFLDPPFPMVLEAPERMAELCARFLSLLPAEGVMMYRIPSKVQVEAALPSGAVVMRRIESGESLILLLRHPAIPPAG
ncbi:MAG: 16S rRNA (guanine(966)-N(2))-methyltransferase RsmD [Planctomycetes bacterium]|nr:16S rRNA (guanine(966)-N(2))-methyltransferase RsmD [Planctomycetota bacterium]